MPKIDVKDLGISFYKGRSETIVFDRITASFDDKKINVILGANGTGKTSLIRAIAGLLNYEGSVLYNGKAMEKVPPQKRNISFISQSYSLYPAQTVFDNIASPLLAMNAPSSEVRDRVFKIADELGIRHCLPARPKQLSGGQQQRVAIARALVKRPSVVFMDEPLSNLDAATRLDIRHYIRDLARAYDLTVLYVTHEIEEATALADTITVIDTEDRLYRFSEAEEILKSEIPSVRALFSK